MLSHGDKVELIGRYLDDSGLRVMVETGLYGGGGSGMNFTARLDLYVIVDKDEENCRIARDNYPPPLTTVLCGDSGVLMPRVLADLQGPALFWLDAHLVVDIDETEALDEWPCPLLAELDALNGWLYAPESTVLIDDVRLFGSYGWPARSQVLASLDAWTVEDRDDVIRCTPRA